MSRGPVPGQSGRRAFKKRNVLTARIWDSVLAVQFGRRSLRGRAFPGGTWERESTRSLALRVSVDAGDELVRQTIGRIGSTAAGPPGRGVIGVVVELPNGNDRLTRRGCPWPWLRRAR